jgi:hypothetical protein
MASELAGPTRPAFSPSAAVKFADVLVSGHVFERRVLMFSSMDASGSLEVLDKRVPGPISVA